MFADFLYLFYPQLCPVCVEPLPKGDSKICPHCFERLPRTEFHRQKYNPAERVFYGRFDFHFVSSALFFSKGSSVQRILHELKYKGGTELGEQLGAWYGLELKSNSPIPENPIFVPVPLHPKKLHKRGYNQAEVLAKGLQATIAGSEAVSLLKRNAETGSQTKRNRFERWQNVETVFELSAVQNSEKRNLVLVDDVLTTGATLEACARALLPLNPLSVSVVTLAFANQLG